MRIFITGGTGLIGSALIKWLQADHKLIVLTRNVKKAEKLFGTDIVLKNDLANVNFNNIDVVINLAGEPIVNKRWREGQKQRICDSRWHLTQELVRHIKAAITPPHTLISGSAIGYYGRQYNEVIDENYPQFNEEFSHVVCRRWEEIAQTAQSEHTRVCILRTGIVLSAKGGALAKMLPAFKLGLGGPIASGKQIMSWIHITDMVRLIHFIIEHKNISGVVHATAPVPVSNQCFSQSLAQQLHRPCKLRVPKRFLELLMGEMSDLLIYGQHVVPVKLLEAGFSFNYRDIDSALLNLLTKNKTTA